MVSLYCTELDKNTVKCEDRYLISNNEHKEGSRIQKIYTKNYYIPLLSCQSAPKKNFQ